MYFLAKKFMYTMAPLPISLEQLLRAIHLQISIRPQVKLKMCSFHVYFSLTLGICTQLCLAPKQVLCTSLLDRDWALDKVWHPCDIHTLEEADV